MASTYVNDLRLNEMATGDASGSWGTVTNTNLELIAEAFSFGTEAITTNANTHTTTIADGGTDPGRSMFLKYTGTLDSACTITIGPNTVSKLWFIENGTSGSQNIIIKQGSGATITIPPGDTKAIYSDGAGSGGKMVDAFASLSVVDLKVQDDLTFSSDSAVISFGADADTTLTHTDGSGLTLNSTNKLMFNDASQFIQGSSATVLSIAATDEIDLTATAIDLNGTLDVSGTALVTGVLTTTAATVFNGGFQSNGAINVGVDDTGYDVKFFGATASAFMQWDASGDDLILGGAAQLGIGNGSTAPTATLDVRRSDASGKIAEFHQNGGFGLEFGSSQAQAYIQAGSSQTLLITVPSDMTIDSGGDITFDAAGADIKLKAAGTEFAQIYKESGGNLAIYSSISDKDIRFQGLDGAAVVTALTLDMSAAGLAIFNAGIALGGSGAANTMDDYEEGTFSLSGAPLYSGGGGTYVKVGSIVHLTGKISTLGVVEQAGFAVSGIPFAPSSDRATGALIGITDPSEFGVVSIHSSTTMYYTFNQAGANTDFYAFTLTYQTAS